jgi:hypothetical protein
MDKVAYMLTRTSPSKREKAAGIDNHEGLSEDELRKLRFETYMRKESKKSLLSSMASDRTKVGDYGGAKYGRIYDGPEGQEFGLISLPIKTPVNDGQVWDPATGLDWGDNTLTQHSPRAYELPPESPEPGHAHPLGENQESTASHRRQSSFALQPLLASPSQPANGFDIDDYEAYPQPTTSHPRF